MNAEQKDVAINMIYKKFIIFYNYMRDNHGPNNSHDQMKAIV